ncbi:ankyrin repeat domain-containing protein [Mycena alexandri]|uniref:Ankyrin repeat domain-containing protein n=1 Tax=Mycena alexandri TaxID=1745969 RepID=A0AAD6WTX8_9AGAR|nr:ankyrin repeat domain-containing protein [Mycena alexandri]
MAEVLGIVEAGLSLLSTALKVKQVIQDAHKAPQEQQKLLAEMEDLKLLLDELRRHIIANPSAGVLRQMAGPLTNLCKDVQDLTERLQPWKGSIGKLKKRVAWPMSNKKKTDEDVKKLEQFKSLINSWLILDFWYAAKRSAIIEWLSPINFFVRQQDISKNRQLGTGEWLLSDPKFKQWKSSTGGILWCSGIPGAGKTVLASLVVDHLSGLQSKDIGVACIYFNHKETQVQTPDNLLAGLWRQLIPNQPLGPVHELHQKHAEKKTRPSYKDIQKLLSLALLRFTQVYVILDGVDEYPENQWALLAQDLRDLGRLNLLILSRPHISPSQLFSNPVTLEICATQRDIEAYVEAQIQLCSRLSQHVNKEMGLKEQICSKISNTVDGMFLLAKLHIDSLHTATNIKEVRQALQDLPTGLHHMYKNILDRINTLPQNQQELAQSALMWVVNAKRPLTSVELCEALAIEPGTKKLNKDNITDIAIVLSVCAGLVIVEEHSSLVRLVHFTTQKYLDEIQTKELTNPHIKITQSLLTYMQFEQFSHKEAILRDKRPPLLQYCQYCLVHAQQCEEQLRDTILEFLKEAKTYREQWYRYPLECQSLPWTFSWWPNSPSSLWIAALVNMVKTASYLLEYAGENADTEVLAVAAYYGHGDICQLLLDKDVDVNADGGSFVNAVQAAVYGGHPEIVQILLNKGADVHAQGGEYENALQAAAVKGHSEIVHILLDKGADVNAQGGRYGHALQAAANGGHLEIVQLFLDKGADVDAHGGYFGHALQAAARGGHFKILQILLAKGADVNAQGGEYGTALQAAAEGGHLEIVQIFLDKGADVNAQGGEYGNALQAATSEGHLEIVQILLDKGADVHAYGGHFGNVLQAAVYRGHPKIVQILLDKGADMNAQPQGGPFGNALQEAVYGGHPEIVQILLDKGAEVNAQGGYFGSSLHAAAYTGHPEIVQILLDEGADVNAQGGEYENALQAAAVKGHSEIVQILLDKGADVHAHGGFFGNALQAAAWGGHSEIVQILLDKGADMNAQPQGRPFGNALQEAAYQGHLDIVQILLDKGADVHAQGGEFGNALQAATEGGHSNIVQILLDKGAEVDPLDGNKLHAAT